MLFLSVFNPSRRPRHPGRREGLQFNLTTPGSLCMAVPPPAATRGVPPLDRPQNRTGAITSGPNSGMNNVCRELSLEHVALRRFQGGEDKGGEKMM